MPRFHSPAARIIGERIRDARRAEGISMDDLSELAEVSLTSVGKIERGTQSPSAETLVRIATALEIDAGSLISGLAAADYGKSTRHYTARDFIREQRARERAATSGEDAPPGTRDGSQPEPPSTRPGDPQPNRGETRPSAG